MRISGLDTVVRLLSARSFRPHSIALLPALLFVGCDGDLPHENGVEWQCRVQAERGGLVVGSHPEDGALWVCANPGVSPSDVRDQCESDCESKWCTFGLTSSFPFITFCTDATCTFIGNNPTPSGAQCKEGSDPGGPARASLDLSGQAVVTADGNSGTASGVTGLLRYSIADCGATACPIHFAEVALNVPTFDLDGYDVVASIHNSINAEGVWHSDTKQFELAPGALTIAANFTIDGESGATTLANTETVTGMLDPSSDQFSLVATFAKDEVTVEITSLTGVHTNRPPQAVIAPASPVECNQTLAAAVELDASMSTDVDQNIERFEWRIDNTDIGSGEVLPRVLPFGPSDVELTVYDSLSAFDKDEETLEVVDTTAPSLVAPPDVLAECTSAAGTPVALGAAAASDVCDDAIDVSNNALALYPLGQTTVTWSAEDFSGNTSQDAQIVTIADTTPPTLTLSVSPDQLWPPNHDLRPITASISVTDICDPAPSIVLVSITSSEPDNDTGGGNTAGDIQNATFGSDDRAFHLRAERQGGGDGRTYTIKYRATDASGNATIAEATVVVPKKSPQ